MENIYTSSGLVKHVKRALTLNTKYMWGGLLRPITNNYIASLKNIYGINAGMGYTTERYACLKKYSDKGYYGVDCIGLIKSYYWSGKADGGMGSPYYGKAGYPDVNAGMMYNAAKVKGPISTLPERPGVIVYCRSHPHVGVYIGGGETIESTLGTRGDGVVKRKLDSLWEYWFECPYIVYPDAAATQSDSEVKACKVLFPVVIREKPSHRAKQTGRYPAGSPISVVVGSDTFDKDSGYTYVRVYGANEAWVVASALK